MITEGYGSLLEADADALVNTVNTVGVMGKGLALQFKRAYPDMFASYQKAARVGELMLGRMHTWPTKALSGPRYIVNFPTKEHWRSASRLGAIESGLADLVHIVRELEITSIAVPPLGCGNGGLDWRDVEPRIREAFQELSDVDVLLYPPGGTPSAAQMANRTVTPSMTSGRAALIGLLERYAKLALDISVIEVQKLLYFLQVAGEPLRLQYGKGLYGPYADNLRHVLAHLEGHYIQGFGDGSARVKDSEPIRLLPLAASAARPHLDAHPETAARINRVMELVAGFESAYGMELLASVHWVAHLDPSTITDAEKATELVQSWTERKARIFTLHHVRTAWDALQIQGWLPQHAA